MTTQAIKNTLALLETLEYWLRRLNPNLTEEAVQRYVVSIQNESVEGRLPAARRMMSEALRWKP